VSRFCHALIARLRRSEEGWLIVETMMGAVVLVVGALAIYNGLDGASKASGSNRNRTEASILAQQDKERMRTMDATALSNYSRVANITVGKLTYTVTSTATYVSDTSGAVSCTNASTTAKYLRIRSSVADPTGRNQPVVEDSLLSPKPADGGAAVQIIDRAGAGISGIPITLAEPPGTTVNTDDQGCALFGFLDSGTDYGVTFSKTGYVDPSGKAQFTNEPITQVPGSTTLTQFQYDLAGSVTANFVTAPTGFPLASKTLSAFNTHVPGAQFRSYTFTGASVVADKLFPFTDPYTFYAGACTTEKPPATSTKLATATVAPGSTTQSVTVTEPTVKVTVNDTNGALAPGAQVQLRSDDDGCTDAYTDSSQTTGTSGAGTGVFQQGFPYGTYHVCVINQDAPLNRTRYGWGDVDNTGDGGTTITIPANTKSSDRNTAYCP
jgi:Tfp pilus assembly protein PilV